VKEYIERNNLKDDSELPSFFTNALLLDYNERLRMQAVWQRYIDGAISSTLNIPHETTKEQVFKIYLQAWKSKLKGITIFRDGCDRVPILSNSSEKKELKRGDLLSKDNLIGLKRTLKTGCGNLHCSAFFDNETGEFVELFLGKGSQGGCLSTLNGLARLVSLSARAGAKLDDIIGQLKSANACPSYVVRTATQKDTSKGSCCPSAIANALKEMSEQIKSMKNITIDNKIEVKAVDSNKLCPMCKSELKHTNGCIECKNCGWTKCNL
jgi:ribonucleoside-diphosphate reductase alpha chain